MDMNEDVVYITFDYTTSETDTVFIFARPFTGGSYTPNYAAHPSHYYIAASGSGDGFFMITSGAVIVDQIQFTMCNSDLSVVILEFFIDVEYQFGP